MERFGFYCQQKLINRIHELFNSAKSPVTNQPPTIRNIKATCNCFLE